MSPTPSFYFTPAGGKPNVFPLNNLSSLFKLIHLTCKFYPRSCATVHSHTRCPELISMEASFRLTIVRDGKSLKLESPNNVTNANYSPTGTGTWVFETSSGEESVGCRTGTCDLILTCPSQACAVTRPVTGKVQA